MFFTVTTTLVAARMNYPPILLANMLYIYLVKKINKYTHTQRIALETGEDLTDADIADIMKGVDRSGDGVIHRVSGHTLL